MLSMSYQQFCKFFKAQSQIWMLAIIVVAALKGSSSHASEQLDYPPDDPRYIWQRIPSYDFDADTSDIIIRFDENFLFGLATAPSHVEDNLDDSWLALARAGGVNAYSNVVEPERRVDFFSNPEVDIDLAYKAGVKVFRLGVSWQRLVPRKPSHNLICVPPLCKRGIQNKAALQRYKEIISMIKDRGMKVMLTLFHHDLPKWAIPYYSRYTQGKLGWLDPHMPTYFNSFARDLIQELGDDIDYVVTFNEPTLFSFLTYVENHWPPGHQNKHCQSLPGLNAIMCSNSYFAAMDAIKKAHKMAYETIKKSHPHIPVGIAHLAPHIKDFDNQIQNLIFKGIHNRLKNTFINDFPDSIISHLDFLGINYYSEERGSIFNFSLPSPLNNTYSDAGRQLNAQGLWTLLNHFHQRYKDTHPHLTYFVTENGIADETDLLRMPFIIEHLKAVSYAIEQGIPVEGFIFWTISDNWEWADGYCPKFGLVHVDRNNNLKRTPKPSYYLLQNIVQHQLITKDMNQYAHSILDVAQSLRSEDTTFAQQWDGNRGFCRNEDGIHGLDEAIRLPFNHFKEWFFIP
ncbi:MAG: family 1 glycosylhydrolase [Proteobacteria bacterium]|nr:family 1 glycosylhydrolase [Pseudomonadota bacterium]